MALYQALPFTVVPQPGDACDCCNTLQWPCVSSTVTRSLWLDASLEIEAVQPIVGNNDPAVTIINFSAEVIYGDTALNISEETTIGNVFGFLVSGATSSIWYAIRVTAALSDDETLSWDIALPISTAVADPGPLPPGPSNAFGLEYDTWFSALPKDIAGGTKYYDNGGELACNPAGTPPTDIFGMQFDAWFSGIPTVSVFYYNFFNNENTLAYNSNGAFPSDVFGSEFFAWFSTLPKTIPSTVGLYWNNGYTLAKLEG
jgi:hypothetical protein